MPRSRTLSAVLLCGACAVVAGCGTAAGPRNVQVSLTAPTDGSTVAVSRIDVLGTIAPKNAVLRLSGKPVRVVGGAFKRSVSLRKGLTRIRIEATAKGFVSSSSVISVRYAPARPAPPGSSAGSGAGFSLPPQTSSPASGGGQSGGGLPPGINTAAFDGCLTTSGGNARLCACLVEQLAKAGYTVAKLQALDAQWRRSFLARGEISYPPAMKQAIVNCAVQSATGGG